MENKILEQIQSLYLPSPQEALNQRQPLPFKRKLEGIRIRNRPVAGSRGYVIYKSRQCNTQGFTIQNCFVGLDILTDSVPDNSILFHCVLEGSCGSPWVELDVVEVIVNAGDPRAITIPLLGADTLSLQTRFVLWAVDALAEIDPNRYIDIGINGVLISGAGF